MTADMLRQARKRAGLTQVRLAGALGVSQGYLSQMESGQRRVSDQVTRRLVRLLGLPATALPLPALDALDWKATNAKVEAGLARLGYPGFAYRRKPGQKPNPTALLLEALTLDDLDARLAEGLPWLLLGFEGWDVQTLVFHAKARDLQNRLGFTVALARGVAERDPLFWHRADELRRLEAVLERSRLAREDTFGRRDTSDRMRSWVRENRSEAAKQWNVLTDLKVEHLPYAG